MGSHTPPDEPLPAAALVSGVLQRFGKTLHEDPLVGYRSLVDRAHGACVRRGGVASNFSAAILVGTQTIGGVAHVSICDNGDALDGEEVRALYAAIRTGRVGAVGRALAASGAGGADAIVGRLGVALLASFVIADRVTIATRRYGAGPEAGVRYICNSRTYFAEPQRIARPGTLVQLRLRPDKQALGALEVVRGALLEHARGLVLPIRVGADPEPINPHAG